jgi:hypothetical protein
MRVPFELHPDNWSDLSIVVSVDYQLNPIEELLSLIDDHHKYLLVYIAQQYRLQMQNDDRQAGNVHRQ